MWLWSADLDKAFLALENAIDVAPVLILPDPALEWLTTPLEFITDCYGCGDVAVLVQQGIPVTCTAEI